MLRRRILCVYRVSLEKLGLSRVSLLFWSRRERYMECRNVTFLCKRSSSFPPRKFIQTVRCNVHLEHGVLWRGPLQALSLWVWFVVAFAVGCVSFLCVCVRVVRFFFLLVFFWILILLSGCAWDQSHGQRWHWIEAVSSASLELY